jgi:hypothetical protein
MAPYVAGLAIGLAAVIALKLSGAADSSRAASDLVTGGLTAITGVLGLWAIFATLLTLRRVQRFGAWRAIANLVGGWFLGGIAVTVLIRTFLFQPFGIPSGGMVPTVLIGDYLFVSKYAYGYTRFSLPFAQPSFPGRILPKEPQRGDVVVFASRSTLRPITSSESSGCPAIASK